MEHRVVPPMQFAFDAPTERAGGHDEQPFKRPAAARGREEFTDLLTKPGVRIERIVSTGQASPPGEWYDQDWDEWVVLLTGAAGLLFEGEAERVLSAGDHIFIPARRRHRVTWTDANQPSIWLAVHIRPEGGTA